jgi:nitrite reductase/ring-hydroxylating ferredoxin subunit
MISRSWTPHPRDVGGATTRAFGSQLKGSGLIMDLTSYLERAKGLDRLIAPVQRAARLLPPGRARDALYGVWLGHPLHPVLVQVPIGTWLSASLLDAWPGNEKASRRLVLAGLAASAPATLAGVADWSEQHEQQMRVGVVHAMANVTAVALYAASAALPARGRSLRLAGLAAASAGGFLGGHIAYRQSAGANQAEPVPHLVEPGWHDLMPVAELGELAGHQPVKRTIGDVPVVVVRDDEGVHVLADRCCHLSGPLSDGEFHDGQLTCPWHGSTFRMTDGSVARGPATAPQPVFRTRVANGYLQGCLPGAG